MNSLQAALNNLSRSKLYFYLSFAFTTLALLTLTTLLLLYSMISQLHSSLASYGIQLFTDGEVAEIQLYFFDRFIYSCLAILSLLVIVCTILFLKRRSIKTFTSINPLSLSLQLVLIILLALFFLMALFVIFESVYQQFLQYFYQYSLDRFNDLPNFVLSNGDSGFAFSVRWPLSMDISSRTFFQLFMVSLTKAGILFTVFVLTVSLFLQQMIHKKVLRSVRN
ncbi:hypothetical protein IGI42_000585 [Enterococcus sp. AZ109]